MSPRVFKEGKLVFWFHCHDVLWERRDRVHVGKGSQNDPNDAKIWLEPQIEIARERRTLNRPEPNQALEITNPASAYTFLRASLIHLVRFEHDYIHIELTDGWILSVPLCWTPTLHNADPTEREKYEISQDRKMIVWDSDKCAIHDEIRIDNYLVPIATSE